MQKSNSSESFQYSNIQQCTYFRKTTLNSIDNLVQFSVAGGKKTPKTFLSFCIHCDPMSKILMAYPICQVLSRIKTHMSGIHRLKQRRTHAGFDILGPRFSQIDSSSTTKEVSVTGSELVFSYWRVPGGRVRLAISS